MNVRTLGYRVGFRPARAREQHPPKTSKQAITTNETEMRRKGGFDN